uniref:Complex 1 LYR protein domain-containing protein n=1 Tax=Timema cristinae TaxID=61476 RepID=A0A7R9D5V1_TIMCR|nr:unnamed protein product [Timema cristinae]
MILLVRHPFKLQVFLVHSLQATRDTRASVTFLVHSLQATRDTRRRDGEYDSLTDLDTSCGPFRVDKPSSWRYFHYLLVCLGPSRFSSLLGIDCLSDLDARMYALRRIRDGFKENKTLADLGEIQNSIKRAEANLGVIKRQVVIGKLYSADKLVIEDERNFPFQHKPKCSTTINTSST